MKKNKLIALVILLFALVIPLNFGFLHIEEYDGAISLISMILVELGVMGALIIGVSNK